MEKMRVQEGRVLRLIWAAPQVFFFSFFNPRFCLCLAPRSASSAHSTSSLPSHVLSASFSSPSASVGSLPSLLFFICLSSPFSLLVFLFGQSLNSYVLPDLSLCLSFSLSTSLSISIPPSPLSLSLSLSPYFHTPHSHPPYMTV